MKKPPVRDVVGSEIKRGSRHDVLSCGHTLLSGSSPHRRRRCPICAYTRGQGVLFPRESRTGTDA